MCYNVLLSYWLLLLLYSMSSALITVDIEIRPYLKKYLLAKSENKLEPLKFPRKSDYNIMLLNLVTNYNTLTRIPIADKENVLNYFKPSKQECTNGSVLIILPFNSKKDVRSYNYLGINNKRKFRQEIRLDFNFEFSRYLYRKLKNGTERTIIVNEFKKLFNITEDDLKSETLYRYSTRLLEELN